MNYNEIFQRWAILMDLSQFSLDAKAMTQTLLLRAYFAKGVRDFEDARQTIMTDEKADDVTKQNALAAKAEEDSGLEKRVFNKEAFESIVKAVYDYPNRDITTNLVLKNGEPTKVEKNAWLTLITEIIVDIS